MSKVVEWRVLDLETLEDDLKKEGLWTISGWEDARGHSPISESSLRKIGNGIDVTDDVMRKFFAFRLYKFRGKINEMKAQHQEDVDTEMRRKCESNLPAVRNPPALPVRQYNPIVCMTIYLKFIHLPANGQSAPIYRRRIERLPYPVEVYDEALGVVTIQYRDPKDRVIRWPGPAAIVDMQPVLAPREKLFHTLPDALPGHIEHLDKTRSAVSQCAYTLINILNGRLLIEAPEAADRMIIIIDLTSALRDKEPSKLVPVANYWESSDDDLRIHPIPCRQTHLGAYLIDTDFIEKTDQFGNGWVLSQEGMALKDGIEIRLSSAHTPAATP